MLTRRSLLAAGAASPLLATAAPALASPVPARPHGTRLTNLAHLRSLLAEVPLPTVPGHSTYRQRDEPAAVAPWTYADRREDGSFDNRGGGDLDPATGHWSQGAYNADDIARAVIVFVRAHRAEGRREDLATARSLLRCLTYLQVDSGPRAGNVVLWQQADGELNPHAEPVELPDPSDSDESYWLARTVWALGEGYAAFARPDPAFAQFLSQRMDLAITALQRASLSRYGTWRLADGIRVPAWLIADGADATAEAVLGLTAYVTARPHDQRAARALRRYCEGITAMSSGGRGIWPYGAILPWTHSLSMWHAWGGLAPAALAGACRVVPSAAMRQAAVADAGTFTPLLMTSGGPDNAWTPMPGEAQIAYGVHGRVAGALAVARMTGGEGLVALGGVIAGWFFGANRAGQPVYDPATGVTVDGIETDGRINRNCGAESTIHALLTMLELDACPAAATVATSLRSIASSEGPVWMQAETAARSGSVEVVTPSSAWTGESNWSGSFLRVQRGSSVRFELGGLPALHLGVLAGATVHPVIHRRAAQAGASRWFAVDARGRRTLLGELRLGGQGDPGITPWEGLLRPFALPRALPRGSAAIVAEVDGTMELDALMILPAVAAVAYGTRTGELVLRASASGAPVAVPLTRTERGTSWRSDGRAGRRMDLRHPCLASGGFAVTRR